MDFTMGIEFQSGYFFDMTNPRQISLFILLPLLFANVLGDESRIAGYIAEIPPESAEARAARLRRVASRRKGTPILVHRGATRFGPENSLRAYKSAMDRGADGVEIDIRCSADGVLYVFHDGTLDRMTHSTGKGSAFLTSMLRPLSNSRWAWAASG